MKKALIGISLIWVIIIGSAWQAEAGIYDHCYEMEDLQEARACMKAVAEDPTPADRSDDWMQMKSLKPLPRHTPTKEDLAREALEEMVDEILQDRM